MSDPPSLIATISTDPLNGVQLSLCTMLTYVGVDSIVGSIETSLMVTEVVTAHV